MKVTIKAAAKVNLLLDLTATLENGYHSIYTVMQSVGIYDTVTVEKTDGDTIQLTCSAPQVPTDHRNTAWQAAEAYFQSVDISRQGVLIHIDKTIPSEAGMAGGSADAAAVIKALDLLFGTQLPEKTMLSLCESIGSDVPFCFLGGTRLCLNKGEIMAPLPDFPDCKIIVVKPDQGISTKEAYANFDAAEWIRHPDNEGFLFAATQQDAKAMCHKAANVFEQVVEVRDRVKIKAIMRNHNAGLAMMTGSGAAIFGVFFEETDAEECYRELKDVFPTAFLSEPTKNGLYVL